MSLKQFDILAFTETWIGNNVDDVSLISSENTGYTLFRSDRKFSGKGGGVALLIKNEHNPVLIESTELRPINLLTVRISDIYFIVTYIPPKTSKITESISALVSYL